MNNQVNQEAKELNEENHTQTYQQHAKPQYAIFKMPFKQLLFMSMTSGAIALAFVTLSLLLAVSQVLFHGINLVKKYLQYLKRYISLSSLLSY